MGYLFTEGFHIVSAMILFGTSIGLAFYLLAANAQKEVPVVYFAIRQSVKAKWFFIIPALVAQLGTGLGIMHVAHFSLIDNVWLQVGITCYVAACVCWLLALVLQCKMRTEVKVVIDKNSRALSRRYWRLSRQWIVLETFALGAVFAAFWFMMTQPF